MTTRNYEVVKVEKWYGTTRNGSEMCMVTIQKANGTQRCFKRKVYENYKNHCKGFVYDNDSWFFDSFDVYGEATNIRFNRHLEAGQGFNDDTPVLSDADQTMADDASAILEEVVSQPVVKAYKYDPNEIIRHEEYDTIKSCIENFIPVYLAGPAGAGKNHVLEQIAKENGYNFYFTNSIQQEHKLTGFTDANGRFHETEFYKACTDDTECIFFLDEIDASIPEVLVLLNAAIANGYFVFETGIVSLEHVHFVAAGNTVGQGADEMYSGRMQIDQATLDRFVIIDFKYDRNIEMHIAKGNEELVEFIHQLRDRAEELGVRATFSYRCISVVAKLEGKMELKKILQIAVFKGMSKDDIRTLVTYNTNKYMNEANLLVA